MVNGITTLFLNGSVPAKPFLDHATTSIHNHDLPFISSAKAARLDTADKCTIRLLWQRDVYGGVNPTSRRRPRLSPSWQLWRLKLSITASIHQEPARPLRVRGVYGLSLPVPRSGDSHAAQSKWFPGAITRISGAFRVQSNTSC